jgi:hypothetical protein
MLDSIWRLAGTVLEKRHPVQSEGVAGIICDVNRKAVAYSSGDEPSISRSPESGPEDRSRWRIPRSPA